MFICRDKSF
uniref:Uncharacterized protein n=1 Tax=Anguilla anguilla TaxID=7936 RepID=A0A0E9SAZ5_ANGAN